MLHLLRKFRYLGILVYYLFNLTDTYSQQGKTITSYQEDTASLNQLLKQASELINIDLEKTDSIYKAVVKRSQDLNYTQGVGAGWAGFGYVQSQKGQFKEAINSYRYALYLLKSVNDHRRAGACLTNIGQAYDNLGLTDSSGIYYLEAIKVLEGTEHYSVLAAAYNNLASLMGDLKNKSKQAEYIQKALSLGKSRNDTSVLIKALCDLASIQVGPDSIQKASSIVREAVALAEVKTDPLYLGMAYTYFAYILREEKKIDSAHWASSRAISNASTAKDYYTYIYASIGLSEILNSLNKQQERANLLKKLVYDNDSVGSRSFANDIYKHLADASFKLGLYKDAYLYHQQFVVYNDSILNEKRNATISELDAKYQTAKKEKALGEKELQLRQSYQYIGFSIGAAAIAILAAALVFVNYRNKRRRHQIQLQNMHKEKELQLLQALMQGEEKERSRIAKDLHDGVAGMLAAAKMQLSSLSIKNHEIAERKEFQQALKLLDDSTQEVRMTSHNLMPEVLLRHGLDEAIRRYCLNISNDSLLDVRYEAFGERKRYIDTFELSVYRIVQELLNNVIKHSQATVVFVQLSAFEDRITIMIEDNGIGLKGNVKNEGMGLQSLETRIKAMNGRFEIQTESNTGLSAYLEFNIEGLER